MVVAEWPCVVSDTNVFVEVITAGTAVGRLMETLDQSGLGAQNKQPLLVTLSAAKASFDRGNYTAGLNLLSTFQNKARAQFAPLDGALANGLIAAAREIIEAVSGR